MMFDPPLQIPKPIKPMAVQLRPSDNRISAHEDPDEKVVPLMCFSEPMDELRNILFSGDSKAPLSRQSSQLSQQQSVVSFPYKAPLNMSIRASMDMSALQTATTPTLGTGGAYDYGFRTSQCDTSFEQQEEYAPEPPVFEFDLPQLQSDSPTFEDSVMLEPEDAPERCANPITRNNDFVNDYHGVLAGRPIASQSKGANDICGAELGLFDLSPPTHQIRSMRI